jgi:16S rRNA (cytidine1402-2'-O)-methyltransferase
MGKLYIVGTPIGNLGDMSPRGVETLREADLIAAEDTRVTRKLLSYFEIHKPIVSYYEHNLKSRGEQIVARILAVRAAPWVTDAGMPCISDPAELLWPSAPRRHRGGGGARPSAAITALALSGLAVGRFVFEGFLTVNRTGRRRQLEALRLEERAFVFYEGPHKHADHPARYREVFRRPARRPVPEMTKLHEELWRTTHFPRRRPGMKPKRRAESFVLVVEGAPP